MPTGRRSYCTCEKTSAEGLSLPAHRTPHTKTIHFFCELLLPSTCGDLTEHTWPPVSLVFLPPYHPTILLQYHPIILPPYHPIILLYATRITNGSGARHGCPHAFFFSPSATNCPSGQRHKELSFGFYMRSTCTISSQKKIKTSHTNSRHELINLTHTPCVELYPSSTNIKYIYTRYELQLDT